MATSQSQLVEYAQLSEDVAANLQSFRDAIPPSSPATVNLTATVQVLLAISTACRRIDVARGGRRYDSSFLRVRNDVETALRSLRLTLKPLLAMTENSTAAPLVLWDRTNYRFEQHEGFPLSQRLEWYRVLLNAQSQVLAGELTEAPRAYCNRVMEVLEAQKEYEEHSRRLSIDTTGEPKPCFNANDFALLHAYRSLLTISLQGRSTSRPGINPHQRPYIRRTDTPVSPRSPSLRSDEWQSTIFERTRPEAPEPPSATSPTFTSTSSRTLSSSYTSYSNPSQYDPVGATHWAQRVFNGSCPLTQYRPAYRSAEPSKCFGEIEHDAIQSIRRDGFTMVLELPFNNEHLMLRFYWRPSDHRARILIITLDSHAQVPIYYSETLTTLRVMRSHPTTLQLLRLHRDGRFIAWAHLRFVHHERMVLFYSTFVSMKRQDSRPIADPRLFESNGLQPPLSRSPSTSSSSSSSSASSDSSLPPPPFRPRHPIHDLERTLFAGQITVRDGRHQLLHALRLLHDRASGVLRLEATPHRGRMTDVPVWTAFITHFARSPTWARCDALPSPGLGRSSSRRRASIVRNATVRLAALDPAPTVFMGGYVPALAREDGGFDLPFTSVKDANDFVICWTGICRARGAVR